MVYRSPMVFTGMSISFTAAAVTMTATRDGGIFASFLGQNTKIAKATSPTPRA